MSGEAQAIYEKAEALRKEKQYREAGELFSTLWRIHHKPDYGWRYAYCLRKLDYLTHAEQIARKVVEAFPSDQWSRNELAWALYYKEVKAAEPASDLIRARAAAEEIFTLQADPKVLHRAAFVTMKIAKQRKEWSVVLQWVLRLDPLALTPEGFESQGKVSMPERLQK